MTERTSDMTNRLQRMITNYKTLGERVDEVLWKEVSDANNRLNSLDVENLRLREELEFYRNEPTPRPSYSGKVNSTSVYKGVSWCPQSEKWRARLVHKGKTTNLGRYESEWEAAEVYNKKAQEFWGEEAFQNVRLASVKGGVSND